ncbi:alpha,alpha-trehalose-phosphate synthase (UDP-forming) [Dokdonella sp.]|uniref:alpha,alpha-trehalose-phosphate synthase (UDP-forming) n=1 Tax=Dokdonella sp. TaxID=2291710 RepID=UPI00263476D0|nr:alpha,alpha-trehalose-phosphate synthase (UDP-forming) [Dokdonella sp.]
MSRLVVISNRVALPKDVRAGGLASAMQSALAETGGLWFGWSGRLVDEGERTLQRLGDGRVDFALLDLTREEYARYYLGFSNRTLWPLLHFRPSLLDYSRDDFAGYRSVNRLFAEHVARLLQPGDRVWVHDYHLIPLGAELRALGVDAQIGFFLHIPLPPRELLAILPHHEHVFSALAAYDLVGVQTSADLDALTRYFQVEYGATIADGQAVHLPDGRRFRAAAFPIGIDTGRVARAAERAANGAATRRLVTSLEHRRLAIGVDRLDYSKGLPQRFEAFGRFLSRHEEWRAKVSLLQIAPPSRSDVPEYRELRSRLERIAGATNGRYAEPDWVPIRYVNRSFNQATLAGFYRAADVGLVTPLRDGMNLVAKEFVAAQPADDPGVLVLSSLAGAARELTQAVLINPHDPDDIVDALREALAMPLHERRERWSAMMDHLRRHDITYWRNTFLEALADT